MSVALVTGPTSGIGRGFAEAFARKGFDLVLVARDRDRLDALAAELSATYGVGTEVITADLADRADVDAVAARLADPTRPVTALVNNAGFGLRGGFLTSTVDEEQRLLDVHVTAVLRLTRAAVPGMVERGVGMVVNVSSMASFVPGGTYSAAKAWVTTFTEGLALDLAGTGVRVTVSCPGYTHTEFHQRAGLDMSKLDNWLWLDVPEVVDRAMRDLALDNPVSVAGVQYRALALVARHGPRTLLRRAATARRRNPKFGRRDQ